MADTDQDAARDYIRRNWPFADQVQTGTIDYRDYVKAQDSQLQDQPSQSPPERPAPSARRDPSPQSTEILPDTPIPQLRSTDMPNPQQYGLGPQQQQNPFQAFFNPMVLLGGLASLAARRPLLGAMSYATGALNGIQQGQQQVFENNKSKFQEALRETIAQNQTDLNRYKAAWDTKEVLDAEKFAKLWTATHDNPTIQALMRSGNFKGAEAAILDLEKNNIHLSQRLQEQLDLADAKDRMKEAEIDRLKQDPGVIARANAVRRYEQPMPPVSRSNPYNQAINELVTEQAEAEGQPYETAGYGAKNKFVTGLGSTTVGSPGGQVNSAKIVIHHLATLDRLIDDLGSGNTAAFRRAAQSVQTEFGLSSAPTNFDAAVGLVAGEIIKLVEGTGGTGEDRNRVVTAFSRANSGPLLHDAVDVAREVMAARVNTLAEQAKANHAESEFQRHLPPSIQKELQPRGKGQNLDDFRKRAKDEGYSDKQIDDFLAKKGH